MKTTLPNAPEALSYLSDKERLSAYELITAGCHHLWSKGDLQKTKALDVISSLVPLAEKDPIFLAHLTSYALRKTQNKDLQIMTTYVNSLSSADGTPFSPKSKYLKPNLRLVSASALHMLDPIMADKLLRIARTKFSVANYLSQGQHFPMFLQTAFRKYIQYRETNPNILTKAKLAGMGPTFERMYRTLHLAPSDNAATILRWAQKGKKLVFKKSGLDFKGLTDLQIAEKIQKEKLPVLGVLGALPRQMSPVVAVAILEQCSGNQAVILRKTFDDAGVLKDPEVMKLYEEKIKTAKTALDRAKTLSETASAEVKDILLKARSEKRKDVLGDIGKVYVHLDASGSMDRAFDVARERGAIIAEMVKNPETNFAWGKYAGSGRELPLPEEFVEDAFRAVLFGMRASGSTDAFSLYPTARKFGADVDIHISDGRHNVGDLGRKIRDFHSANPSSTKPKACVVVLIEGNNAYGDEPKDSLAKGYEANGIPVATVKPEALTESALVAEAIRTAILGPIATVDEIMQTELLKLPNYYYAL